MWCLHPTSSVSAISDLSPSKAPEKAMQDSSLIFFSCCHFAFEMNKIDLRKIKKEAIETKK